MTPPTATEIWNAGAITARPANSPAQRLFGLGIWQRTIAVPRWVARSHPAIVFPEPSGVVFAFLGAPIRTTADVQLREELEYATQAYAIQEPRLPPSCLAAELNRAFVRWRGTGKPRAARQEPFFAARFDVGTGKLDYTNGGHEAVVVRREGSPERLVDGGPPLGAGHEIGYFDGVVSLADSGDTLLVMNTGLRNHVMHGELVEFTRENRDAVGHTFWLRLLNQLELTRGTGCGDAALLMVKRADLPYIEMRATVPVEPESHIFESKRVNDVMVRSCYSTLEEHNAPPGVSY